MKTIVASAKLTSPRNGFKKFFWKMLMASFWWISLILHLCLFLCCTGSADHPLLIFNMLIKKQTNKTNKPTKLRQS